MTLYNIDKLKALKDEFMSALGSVEDNRKKLESNDASLMNFILFIEEKQNPYSEQPGVTKLDFEDEDNSK